MTWILLTQSNSSSYSLLCSKDWYSSVTVPITVSDEVLEANFRSPWPQPQVLGLVCKFFNPLSILVFCAHCISLSCVNGVCEQVRCTLIDMMLAMSCDDGKDNNSTLQSAVPNWQELKKAHKFRCTTQVSDRERMAKELDSFLYEPIMRQKIAIHLNGGVSIRSNTRQWLLLLGFTYRHSGDYSKRTNLFKVFTCLLWETFGTQSCTCGAVSVPVS